MGKIVLAHLVEKAAGKTKLAGNLLCVICVSGHAHETCDADVGKVAPFTLTEHLNEFVGRESEFCFLLGDVDLQQTVDGAVATFSLPIDFFQKFE